jgi:hypothetical protein
MALENGNARRKVALITGITGQDGSYLAELLIDKVNKNYFFRSRKAFELILLSCFSCLYCRVSKLIFVLIIQT